MCQQAIPQVQSTQVLVFHGALSLPRLSLQSGDGWVRVHRRRNDRYADWCVLEEIASGVGVLSWPGQPLPVDIVHHQSSLMAIEMLNGTAMTFSLLASFLCSITTTTSPCFSMIMPPLNFLRTNNIDFIDDWPANSPYLNPIEHVWDCLDTWSRRRSNPPANVNKHRAHSGMEQYSTGRDQHFSQFYVPAMHCSGQFSG